MSADARVVDVAYSRYDGPRAGRLAAIWSLARWSALRALGARRGWKAKLIPITLILLAFAPALVVLGLRALFGTTVFTRRARRRAAVLELQHHHRRSSSWSSASSMTPELVCPDRRDRTLSLYFSTAIGRGDYVIGKVLAALMPLLLVTLAPPLILYAGNLLFAVHPVGYLDKHARRHPPHRRLGTPDRGSSTRSSASRSRRSPARRAFAVGGYLAFLSSRRSSAACSPTP